MGLLPPSWKALLLENVKVMLPVFWTVTVNGAELVPLVTVPKSHDVGVTVAMGCTPVPERATVATGRPGSLVVITSVPVRTPMVVGVNLALTRQLAPAFRLPPTGQLVESLKFTVGQVMLMICSGEVPTLVIVTCCAAEVVPTNWFPNVNEVVLRLTEVTIWGTAAEDEPLKLLSPL